MASGGHKLPDGAESPLPAFQTRTSENALTILSLLPILLKWRSTLFLLPAILARGAPRAKYTHFLETPRGRGCATVAWRMGKRRKKKRQKKIFLVAIPFMCCHNMRLVHF